MEIIYIYIYIIVLQNSPGVYGRWVIDQTTWWLGCKSASLDRLWKSGGIEATRKVGNFCHIVMPFSLLADKASINDMHHVSMVIRGIYWRSGVSSSWIGAVAVVSYTGWEIGRFPLPNVLFPETVSVIGGIPKWMVFVRENPWKSYENGLWLGVPLF